MTQGDEKIVGKGNKVRAEEAYSEWGETSLDGVGHSQLSEGWGAGTTRGTKRGEANVESGTQDLVGDRCAA